MKLLFMFLLVLLLPGVLAQEKIENFHKYQELDLKFHISAPINLDFENQKAKMSEMQVDLSFFPRENDYQSIIHLDHLSTPQANVKETEKYTTFTWYDLTKSQQVEYGIDAIMRTNNYLHPINKKVPFPYTNIDPEYLQYTKESEFIDFTQEINQQARTLVKSTSDYYAAIVALADWTKTNIEYDLSTFTANAVQKSSWVLENKQGVCDELTNLFISMLRSQGIPAKFVSGMVYSNTDYSWGPHGWAEVYIPSYGWVPFDVTFGQYGWLDPSHIKLKDDADSGSASAEYSWKSVGVEVDVLESEITTSLQATGKEVNQFIEVDINPYKKAVSPGSFVPLLVNLKNTKDIYSVPTVTITKAPGLIGTNVRHELLGPRESKTVAWVVQIPEEAKDNFIYTSTLEVQTTFGNTASSSLKYSKEYGPFTRLQAKNIIDDLKKKAEKDFLETATITCATKQEFYYEEDNVEVTCAITNTHHQAVTLNACVKGQCQDVRINPSGTETAKFYFKPEESGRISATIEYAEKISYTFFDLNVVKVPEISITDVTPKSIPYGETADISFTLNTNTPLQDIHLDAGGAQLNLDNIKIEKNVRLSIPARNIINGLQVDMVYKDVKGKSYETHQIIKIEITDIPWYASIIYWIASFF
jgi:transglutaminase-like putative cysteine protease